MSKHTPGPWKIARNVYGNLYIYAPGNGWIVWEPNTAQGNVEANTRLIAAAPDLLAALKRCRAGTITWAEVDAVIAKVEG